MARMERKKQLTRIASVEDSNGTPRQVKEVSEYVRIQTLDGAWSNWAFSSASWSLDGKHVNPTDSDDKMEVALTGEVLTVLSWDPPDRPYEA